MKRGNIEHERELKEYIQKCPNKIIDLGGKSPDAIEAYLENGQIKLIAVEVLTKGMKMKGKGWHHSWTETSKRQAYSMFDDIKIIKV